MEKKSQGFTLIELLVALTIVALLAAVALVSLQGARKGARDARRKADLEEIRAALEMCRADTGEYPIAAGGDITEVSCGGVDYLSPAPIDPIYSYYYYQSNGTTYSLCARLEGVSTAVSGCGETTGCGGQQCTYKAIQP